MCIAKRTQPEAYLSQSPRISSSPSPPPHVIECRTARTNYSPLFVRQLAAGLRSRLLGFPWPQPVASMQSRRGGTVVCPYSQYTQEQTRPYRNSTQNRRGGIVVCHDPRYAQEQTRPYRMSMQNRRGGTVICPDPRYAQEQTRPPLQDNPLIPQIKVTVLGARSATAPSPAPQITPRSP